MDRKSLEADFVRVEHVDERVLLSVCHVDWHGHRPELRWEVVADMPTTTTAEEVRTAVDMVLAHPAYFGECAVCGQWLPAGHMHGPGDLSAGPVCHGCAQSEFGVVY
jgi:hypothetical protein